MNKTLVTVQVLKFQFNCPYWQRWRNIHRPLLQNQQLLTPLILFDAYTLV